MSRSNFLSAFFLACMMALLPSVLFAQHGHAHHAKHNMIMMGTDEVFISHIVYKVPHNYQVILKIELEKSIHSEYLKIRQNHPDSLVIILLDHMDISKIADASFITGTILVENAQGDRTEMITHVKIAKENFQIVYFDEVPLILTRE